MAYPSQFVFPPKYTASVTVLFRVIVCRMPAFVTIFPRKRDSFVTVFPPRRAALRSDGLYRIKQLLQRFSAFCSNLLYDQCIFIWPTMLCPLFIVRQWLMLRLSWQTCYTLVLFGKRQSRRVLGILFAFTQYCTLSH